MEQPKVVHSTFVVERNFANPPQTVFAAFSDPAKARRWYGEGDVTMWKNSARISASADSRPCVIA